MTIFLAKKNLIYAATLIIAENDTCVLFFLSA